MHPAFLGLGMMGYPMTGHLAHAGHDVVVFDAENGERRAAGENTHAVIFGADAAFATQRKRSIFGAPVESHNFARAARLDLQAVIGVISKNEALRGPSFGYFEPSRPFEGCR